MKIRRKLRGILTVCLIVSCTALYGCGSNSYKNSMDDAGSMTESKSDVSASSQMQIKNETSESIMEEGPLVTGAGGESIEDIMEEPEEMDSADNNSSASMDESKENTDSADDAGGSSKEVQAGEEHRQNEKLIYTYRYSVETKEFDDFTEKIAAKTAQLGGYVETSETNGSASDGLNRYANMTLRIPAGQVHQLLSMLDTESNVTYRNSSVENVSLQYTDLESHIKALRIEQDTLLRLLEEAEKLKDIITLQSKLSEVRYEIESYESQLRLYDNMIDYSTVHLDINEVERTTTVTPARASFGKEVKDLFSDNLYGVGQFLRSSAVWLIGSLPVLVPAAVLIWMLVLLVRRWSRSWRTRRPALPRQNTAGYQSIYKRRGMQSNNENQAVGQQESGRRDAEAGENENTDKKDAEAGQNENTDKKDAEAKQ